MIKLGGTGVESPGSTPILWRSLIELSRAERSAGRAGVVLVHGGGKAVDAHLDRLGYETERRQGLRVTPPEQMEQIAAVLGRINKSIVGALQACGQAAIGLCPGECATATLARLTPGGEDIGLVGEVTGGDPAFVSDLLARGIIPVFSPIGIDADGGFLNINADDAAAGLASIQRASRLVLLTDVPGVRGDNGQIISETTATELEHLIAQGIIHGGMVPKVRAAVRAVTNSGVPVLIASWNEPERLSRLGSADTPGTCILAKPSGVLAAPGAAR